MIIFRIISYTVYSKVKCNRKFNNLNRKMLLSKPQGRKNLAGHALSIRLVRVLTRILSDINNISKKVTYKKRVVRPPSLLLSNRSQLMIQLSRQNKA